MDALALFDRSLSGQRAPALAAGAA